VADRYTLKRRVEVISADLLQITFSSTWRNYDGRTLTTCGRPPTTRTTASMTSLTGPTLPESRRGYTPRRSS
jgi:hypothetical protein